MAATKSIFALLAIFSLGVCVLVGDGHAATQNAASASFADVSAAVAAASPGDTVQVPAGSATWATSTRRA